MRPAEKSRAQKDEHEVTNGGRRISVLYFGLSRERWRVVSKQLRNKGYVAHFRDAGNSEDPTPLALERHHLLIIDDYLPEAGPPTDTPFELAVTPGKATSLDRPAAPVMYTDLERLVDVLTNALKNALGSGQDNGNGNSQGNGQAGALETRPGSRSRGRSRASVATEALGKLLSRVPGTLYCCRTNAADEKYGLTEYVSPNISDLTGKVSSHFSYRTAVRLHALVHPGDRRKVVARIGRALQDKRNFNFEHRIITASGAVKWVRHSGQACTDEDGYASVDGFVIDVTDRKTREEQLHFMASRDPLTGLANRTHFRNQLEKSINRASRHHELIACLFVDIDRFKQINDRYGHDVGDALLKEVSRRLERCVRTNDLIGRPGGDEFTILLDGISDPMDAATVASKMLAELAKPMDVNSHRVSIGCSIGISCFPTDAGNGAELISNSDAAMYEVKRSGRNGIRFFSRELSERFTEDQSRTQQVSDVLRSGGFQLHYQLRFDLDKNAISAFEVSLRMPGEENQLITTEDILRAATESGELEALYTWLMEALLKRQKDWSAAGLPAFRFALSAGREPHVFDTLGDAISNALRSTGFDPNYLLIEFNEEAIMRSPVAVTTALTRLQAMGVATAVDGISFMQTSLDMLRRISVEYFKLNGRMIGDIPDDRNGVALIGGIIGLAQRLNLRIIAQDVTNESQAVFLRANECNEAQGPLFSGPLTAEEVGQIVHRKLH